MDTSLKTDIHQLVLKPRKYTWGEILDSVWLGTTLATIWAGITVLLVGIVFSKG